MLVSLFKKFKKKVLFILIPFLGQLLIRMIYYTNRKKKLISPRITNDAAIYVFWHGNLLLQPFFLKFYKTDRAFSVIISEHDDGEFIAQTMKYFSIGSLRGSSRKGAAKALIQALKFAKSGGNIVITPDGPRGPRHSVADGVVTLSEKLDLPIIVQSVVPSKYWRIKSWDQFIIPKPFGTLTYIASDPFRVSGLSMDEAKKKVKERLMEHAF